MTKTLFRKAIKKMIDDGEFERLINSSKNVTTKKRITKLYEKLKLVRKKDDLETFPIIPLIMMIDSASVYQDIIVFMLELEGKYYDE